ncbi:AsnC family transcriptional regulator [Vibrio sinaloensis DSM 21326]|uniref:AsnC family transcriptional regulator n=1 Tax=Vibrio sinaloensis DSM 21326 TaxID=945550 RepID=E8M5E2_PHOS4|nr:AsnC family transcriptional regulator [Vibrio sinaloensis DSM 21326]
MEIDRIDRKILAILQANNRIANVDLAAEVGLSPPACLKRVKRLRDEKVIIGDVALINPALAGNKMTLLVSVEMERDRGDIYSVFRQSVEKAPRGDSVLSDYWRIRFYVGDFCARHTSI